MNLFVSLNVDLILNPIVNLIVEPIVNLSVDIKGVSTNTVFA